VNDRYRDNFVQFDVAANLELGNCCPKILDLYRYLRADTNHKRTPGTTFDQDIKLKG
jgi:hypothetical protein